MRGGVGSRKVGGIPGAEEGVLAEHQGQEGNHSADKHAEQHAQ